MRDVALTLALLTGLSSVGMAQGRKDTSVTPEFRSEGREVVLFSTSCYETYWTVPTSSDAISRSFTIYASSGNTSAVCLSTTTNSATKCNNLTGGIDLLPGASLTDYTTIQWTCRSYGGTQSVKGYRSRDKGDSGLNTYNSPVQ